MIIIFAEIGGNKCLLKSTGKIAKFVFWVNAPKFWWTFWLAWILNNWCIRNPLICIWIIN
jgi:hypothetical protein